MLDKQTLKRRDFLSHVATVGTVAVLGAAAVPVHAGAKPGRGPIRLDSVTLEDFSHLVGQVFQLQQGGATASARLMEATPQPADGDRRRQRQPFFLIFQVRGAFDPVQDHYWIHHDRLGALKLFMVPVDLLTQSIRLEAVFA